MSISVDSASSSPALPDFSEDNFISKALAALIPLVGSVVSDVNIKSLSEKVTQTTDANRLAQLAKIKNDYHFCDCIRSSIVAITFLAGAILGTFGMGLSGFIIGVSLLMLNSDRSLISHNKGMIQILKTTGYSPAIDIK